MHYSLLDVRIFDWWNYGLKKKFKIIPKYSAIINFEGKNYKEITSLYRYVRRYEIKHFIKYQNKIETCKSNFTEMAKLYIKSNSTKYTKKEENNLKKDIKFLCNLANDGFGKVSCFKDKTSNSLIYFNIVLFDKKSAHLIINSCDKVWKRTGIMAWGVDNLLKDNIDKSKLFDFNGANSPARGDDKHSYGAKKNYISKLNIKLWIFKKTYQILPEEFRLRIIFIFFSSILVVLLEVFSIALILPLLTILINPDKLSFLNNYFDFEILISNLDKNEIIIYGISFFLFIIICKILALFLLNIYKTNFYFDVRVRMTEILFRKYLHESYLFHIYNNSSTLITNVHGEIGLFIKKILNVFSDIFLDLILFFLLLTILLNIRLFETLFALSAFIIFLLTYFYLIKKRLDFWGKERQKKDRSKLKHIQQSLFGIKELKIYLKETFFEKILLNIVRKRENIAKKVAYISPLPRYFLELGTVIFILIFKIFFTKTTNFFSTTSRVCSLFCIIS